MEHLSKSAKHHCHHNTEINVDNSCDLNNCCVMKDLIISTTFILR